MGINVLIADQERTFADTLAARLDAESDIEVVGAVQVKMLRSWLIARKPADVLVLDGDLPGEAANRLCEELSGRDGRTRVIMLTSSSEPTRIVQAIRAGAAAWVRKDESLEHLLNVIRGVAQGRPGCHRPRRGMWCGCCCGSGIGIARASVCSPRSHHVSAQSWLAWPRAPSTVAQ